jgi:glycine cleavage system H protein
MSNEIPADLRYTKEHEWAKKDGGDIAVGITAFAVEQLGDITLVSVDAKIGDHVAPGKAFGTIESVKTLSDLYAPIAGKISAINAVLADKPELVNEDCYDKGWMVKITPEDAKAVDALLDATKYAEHVKASS